MNFLDSVKLTLDSKLHNIPLRVPKLRSKYSLLVKDANLDPSLATIVNAGINGGMEEIEAAQDFISELKRCTSYIRLFIFYSLFLFSNILNLF